MLSILHITADYPDSFSGRKTRAVQSLINGTGGFDHWVYSLNRLTALGGVQKLAGSDRLTCLAYGAPPYGILLETFLKPVTDWILRDLTKQGTQVDVIHAHKLTIEGLIARRLAAALGCPYICSVWGNTDQKYLRSKPEKIHAYRKVAFDAAYLLPITPWVQRYLIQKLGVPIPKAELLPTITECDQFISPSPAGGRFVTVFSLDQWRLKGMPNLLSAVRVLKAQGIEITLDVIGGGNDTAIRALQKAIEGNNLEGNVNLLGSIKHTHMQRTLNAYSAFVMPTLRETFGMVYIEALFSGVPILYSKDRGIDGYFDTMDVGFRANPDSIDDITEGLLFLCENETKLKCCVGALQEDGRLDFFRKKFVCQKYRNIVLGVIDEARR